MKKGRISEIYCFLEAAHMGRMTDEEKIAFIRLLRKMKPTAREISDAACDAMEKARTEGMKDVEEFMTHAIGDITSEDVDIDIATMKQDTFDRLVLSNDWTFGQIEELEAELVRHENP